MHPRKALLHAIVAIALLGPALAQATTITIDAPAFASLLSSNSPNPVPLGGTLPAFDAGLGTLTQVTIRTIGVGSAFLSLNAPQAGLYSGPLSVVASVLDASHALVATGTASLFGTVAGLAAGPGPLLLQDGNSWVATIEITSGLGAFLLAGSYTLHFDFFGSVSGPGLPSQPYVADSFDGSILVDSVTYTYTPVPEPSTALLVGLGLAGLAARRARPSR